MGWITQLRFLFHIYHHSHLKSSSEMCFVKCVSTIPRQGRMVFRGLISMISTRIPCSGMIPPPKRSHLLLVRPFSGRLLQ